MSNTVDRVGSGLTILLFGVSPWAWTTLMVLARGPLRRAFRHSRDAVEIGTAAAALVGGLAVLVALVSGSVAHWGLRRRRRLAARGGGPERADHGTGATLVARVATWTAIATLWGEFGALALEPLVPSSYLLFPNDSAHTIAVSMAVLTLTATLVGVGRLTRRSNSTTI